MNFNSINQVLNFAIAREEKAHRLYTHIAEQMAYPEISKLCETLAGEELQHKEKLQQQLTKKDEAVSDLDVSDYVVDGNVDIFMDYEEFLTFAFKKEDASVRLYTDLADKVKDRELRQMLLSLVREETEHRNRFKTVYENLLK